MKDFRNIALFVLLVGAVPLFTDSGVMLNFVMTSLYACLLSQAWNVLGGFGGQFSFGHALFFGTGAYVQAIAQMQWGLSPWVALPLAMVFAAGVGAFVGAASFRYGLKGSYFALITLAFAEVLRILVNSVEFTGGGLGLLIPAKIGANNFQFSERIGFYFVILTLTVVSVAIAVWLKHSRFGAQLAAIRENEDAAMALGINVFNEKVKVMVLSGAMCGIGGSFFAQYFLYIDPTIVFGVDKSVEMLLVSMIGGAGTVYGPLIGAVLLAGVSDVTRVLTNVQGLSLVLYGTLLVIIIAFLPNGLIDLFKRLGKRIQQRGQ